MGTPEEELIARLRAAEAKAWWRDLTQLVSPGDLALAVIAPRTDTTADELMELGQALERWRAGFPQARHIWGLAELLEGRCPRTPPIYLSVPFSLNDCETAFEPVALVFVAAGTDTDTAQKHLYEHLSGFQSKLAWLTDPDSYSYYQR